MKTVMNPACISRSLYQHSCAVSLSTFYIERPSAEMPHKNCNVGLCGALNSQSSLNSSSPQVHSTPKGKTPKTHIP